MGKTVRVGVIGCGAISGDHCEGVRRHPDAELAALCDISEKRLKEQAKRHGVARTFAKWEALVACPDLDAVTVALPNYLHAPVSIAALKAGKHVCCEKPFATAYAEAKAVADAAKKAKKVFAVGMNARFARDRQVVKALVERGELGDVYHARAYYLRRFGAPKRHTWFGHKKLAGGGCLYDIGVHALDLCMHLMDNFQPESVSGRVFTRIATQKPYKTGWGRSDPDPKLVFDVDDFAVALVKLRGGQVIELSASWALMLPDGGGNNIELHGDRGGAQLYPARLVRPAKREGEYDVIEPQGVKIRYEHCSRFVNWIDAILGRDALCATPEQSLAVQKVLDAVYASSASGGEVRIR